MQKVSSSSCCLKQQFYKLFQFLVSLMSFFLLMFQLLQRGISGELLTSVLVAIIVLNCILLS